MTSPNAVPVEVPVRDWSDLLAAVQAQLRKAAGELSGEGLEARQPAAPHRVQSQVLHCVAALEQLRATLAHELGQRHPSNQTRCVCLASEPGPALSRRVFEGCLDNAFAAGDAVTGPRGFALLYLNLDGFNDLNELHGPVIGDEVLRIVASRLARTVRSGDIVGRLGSDEFACLIGGAPNRMHLVELACKLFDVIGARMMVCQRMINVHASIGIAIHPTDGGDGAALLAGAEAAMQRAKQRKTGYAFYDDRADLWANDPLATDHERGASLSMS
jgi:diguanylate cyclase